MTRRAAAARLGLVTLFFVGPVGWGPTAWGFDPSDVYRDGTWVLSGEAGYGAQIHVQDPFTGLEFVNAGVRVGLIPFGIAGPRVVRGALEVGLEPVYQRYVSPVDAFYAGLALALRYHFTSLGRFVPYVELAGAAGGTDLRVVEQQRASDSCSSAG